VKSIAVGYVGILLSTALLAQERVAGRSVALFLALAGTAGAAYLWIAARWIGREPGDDREARAAEADPRSLLTPRRILLAALALRIVPFFSAPYLSDDYHRYLWEGHVQRHGFSPYAHAPDDPLLERLRNDHYPGVNHKEVSALYPPLAQWLFRFNPAGQWGLKLVLLGADLATIWIVLRLLARRGRRSELACLVAFHPLLVLEFTASLHIDGLALAVVWAALYAAEHGRRIGSAALVAAAGLVKPQGLVAAVGLLAPAGSESRGGRSARPRALPLVLLLLLWIGAWIPFQVAGGHLLRGTRQYAEHWEFNGLLHPAVVFSCEQVKAWCEGHTGEGWIGKGVRECGYAITPRRHGRLALLALFGGLALLFTLRWRAEPIVASGAILVAFLATTPTLHPWYGAWLIPFLPFLRSRALGLFSVLLMLSHVVKIDSLRGGAWSEPAWLGPAVWLLPCVLGAWELTRRNGNRRGCNDPASDDLGQAE
jgi:hypothetical protein